MAIAAAEDETLKLSDALRAPWESAVLDEVFPADLSEPPWCRRLASLLEGCAQENRVAFIGSLKRLRTLAACSPAVTAILDGATHGVRPTLAFKKIKEGLGSYDGRKKIPELAIDTAGQGEDELASTILHELVHRLIWETHPKLSGYPYDRNDQQAFSVEKKCREEWDIVGAQGPGFAAKYMIMARLDLNDDAAQDLMIWVQNKAAKLLKSYPGHEFGAEVLSHYVEIYLHLIASAKRDVNDDQLSKMMETIGFKATAELLKDLQGKRGTTGW